MWLFKEIVEEVLNENNRWSSVKETGGLFDVSDDLDRAFIIFNGEKQPIYSLGEMINEFRTNYLINDEKTTSSLVIKAYEDNFFKRWIPTRTINTALKVNGHPNKGNALELILGKKIDNKQFSDLPDAELKSYNENVGYHELFMLSPYNFRYWNPETLENKILRNDAEVNKVLASFKEKIKAKSQSKWITTNDYTNYEAIPNKAFARAIININKNGDPIFEGFDIETEFFGIDENENLFSLGFIISRYNIEDTESELLYQGSRGVLKQTLPQVVSNKIFTIISFPTRSLTINNKGVTNYKVLPNDNTIYNEFYQYTRPEIYKISNLNSRKELVFNFIEAINDGNIIISFGFDNNLHMKTKFIIKNSQEVYDNLYKTNEDTRMLYGGNTEITDNDAEIVIPWTNHNCCASQNSIDQGYDYVGELWDESGSGENGFVVEKYVDTPEGSWKRYYNVENEDEEIVFPVWFDDFETDDETPEKDKLAMGGNDALLIGHYKGKRYLLNWVTGEIGNIE